MIHKILLEKNSKKQIIKIKKVIIFLCTIDYVITILPLYLLYVLFCVYKLWAPEKLSNP